ncbi:MAG: phosphatase PAP2 family protein [Kofleriaceae bacterium]
MKSSRRVPLLLMLCIAWSAGVAAADPAAWHQGPAGKRRVARLVGVSAAGLLYASSETLFKGGLAPDDCRWCAPPSFDRSVRSALVWTDRPRAKRLSDLTGYVTAPIFGVGITALMAAQADRDDSAFGRILDDTLPIFEAVAYSELIVQAVKFSVGRQRPRVRFAEAPVSPSDEDNLSFFSGHTTLVFAIATSAGVVAHRRGYATEPAVWSLGMGLAATTGFLRIAADQHYFSDVLLGAAFGATAGYLAPRLFAFDGGAHHLSWLPTGNGLALVGTL